jgi:thiopeptide-type bacteriocin biosynthesis protein
MLKALELEGSSPVDWFFVRYSDPFGHLRLRIRDRSESRDMLRTIIEFCDGLRKQGLIERFALDTYSREIERYGGPQSIEATERAFCEDSRYCLSALMDLRNDPKERVLRTIIGFNKVLERLPVDFQKMLLGKVKPEARRLSPTEWAAVRTISGKLHEARVHVCREESAIDEIIRINAAHGLTRPLTDVLLSFLHMHCNRMGISSGKEERTTLDLLWHSYNSLAMRADSEKRKSLNST